MEQSTAIKFLSKMDNGKKIIEDIECDSLRDKHSVNLKRFSLYNPETDELSCECFAVTSKQAATRYFQSIIRDLKIKDSSIIELTVREHGLDGFHIDRNYRRTREKLKKPITFDSLTIDNIPLQATYRLKVERIENKIHKYHIVTEYDGVYKSVKSNSVAKAAIMAVNNIVQQDHPVSKQIEFYLDSDDNKSYHFIAKKNDNNQYIPKLITRQDLIEMMQEKINNRTNGLHDDEDDEDTYNSGSDSDSSGSDSDNDSDN